MTSDLTAFISARLDEDETTARQAASFSYGVPDWCDEGDPDGIHIARHDPARVLREVAVLRAIVTSHHYDRGRCDSCEYDCPVSALAAIWSDHPDYRQEWAP